MRSFSWIGLITANTKEIEGFKDIPHRKYCKRPRSLSYKKFEGFSISLVFRVCLYGDYKTISPPYNVVCVAIGSYDGTFPLCMSLIRSIILYVCKLLNLYFNRWWTLVLRGVMKGLLQSLTQRFAAVTCMAWSAFHSLISLTPRPRPWSMLMPSNKVCVHVIWSNLLPKYHSVPSKCPLLILRKSPDSCFGNMNGECPLLIKHPG